MIEKKWRRVYVNVGHVQNHNQIGGLLQSRLALALVILRPTSTTGQPPTTAGVSERDFYAECTWLMCMVSARCILNFWTSSVMLVRRRRNFTLKLLFFVPFRCSCSLPVHTFPSDKAADEPDNQHGKLNEPQIPISALVFKTGSKLGSYKSGDLTFYSLIDKYAALGDFESLETLIGRMRSERRVFQEKSFIIIFKAYGRAHLPDRAVELFHRMSEEFQCVPTVRSFNSVLNVLIIEGLFQHALEFHSYVVRTYNTPPNVLTYNLLLKALCKLGFIDQAIGLFREMPVRGCHPDAFTYATLMDGLCKKDRIEEAMSLLDEMQVEGCFPNSVTFNILISGLCKKGDLSRAAKFVDNMLLKGITPNEVTYNTLLHGLCMKGKLDRAIGLLNRMVSNKCVPNSVTYGTIINGLVKQGRAVDGVNLLISMEERGQLANEHMYSSLLSGLFKEGRSEDALRIWKKMLENGCKPNIVLYSSLIDGLCLDGKPDEAREILAEMRNNGCEPNSFTYSSLMRGFFKAGYSFKAISLWKEIKDSHCEYNEVCYSVLIDGLSQEGKINEAKMVWKQMIASGFQPDVVSYTALIHGLCNAGLLEQALNLFNDMLLQRCNSQPDVVTYNIILAGLCRESSITRAIDFLSGMLDEGCDPDLVTCNVLLKALREKVNPPQDGRNFLDELVCQLLNRQRIIGASNVIEVMICKYLIPRKSTLEKVVVGLCKPQKVQAAINRCWHDLFC
ncbi:hypothetical protein QQ045_003306 [Rhodiola kirilowii]